MMFEMAWGVLSIHIYHEVSMNLRSSTEYEIAAPQHHMLLPLIRHAGEGRHPGEGGDGYRLSPVWRKPRAFSSPRSYLHMYFL